MQIMFTSSSCSRETVYDCFIIYSSFEIQFLSTLTDAIHVNTGTDIWNRLSICRDFCVCELIMGLTNGFNNIQSFLSNRQNSPEGCGNCEGKGQRNMNVERRKPGLWRALYIMKAWQRMINYIPKTDNSQRMCLW